jgi:hypothetical protein
VRGKEDEGGPQLSASGVPSCRARLHPMLTATADRRPTGLSTLPDCPVVRWGIR